MPYSAGDRSPREPPNPSRRVGAVVQLPAKAGFSLSKLLGRLRFRHLSLLVALDEHRNLHRAAKAVHLAQPSASKLVHDLELLFGASLFDRSPTGMQPTELGTVVLAFASRALSDLKRLAAELDHRRAGRHGYFVIGTTTDLLPGVVAHAMAEIKRRRPMLTLRLVGDSGDRAIDHLIEGQSDVAVGYFRGDPRRGEIDYEVIGNGAICIVARQHHPLGHVPRLSVYGLESAAWILHLNGIYTGQILERIFLRAGMKPPTNVIESNSLTTTLDMVLKSDAVTILPEEAVRQHLQAGQLVRLPVAVSDHSIEFGILTRRGEPLCPATLEFSELLRRFGGCSDGGVAAPTYS
jgi:DNA-binding transcriptional LysR family regulator